eukprot:TRINITY_DN4767_c0_g1_i1.p1 TRINITY_DN4767_c0_g1~~TRINITY_DN4767_c0_g1_i1.p1  ORF type:complete len:146 (+),score=35.25 TRINITY_DN4767_c0_g1_i1:75-512(+)
MNFIFEAESQKLVQLLSVFTGNLKRIETLIFKEIEFFMTYLPKGHPCHQLTYDDSGTLWIQILPENLKRLLSFSNNCKGYQQLQYSGLSLWDFIMEECTLEKPLTSREVPPHYQHFRFHLSKLPLFVHLMKLLLEHLMGRNPNPY